MGCGDEGEEVWGAKSTPDCVQSWLPRELARRPHARAGVRLALGDRIMPLG